MRFLRCRFAIAKHGAAVCGLILAAGISVQAQDRNVQQPGATSGSSSRANSKNELPDAVQPRYVPERITFDNRLKLYVRSISSFESFIGPAAAAGIGQGENEPPEWGQGAAGYARRFGSGYGRLVISESIRFGVAAGDREDPRFEPSNESGIWRRAKHAIAGNFISHTESGRQIPAYSRIAGPYGAAFISNAWYPSSQNDSAHALERGTTAFGSTIGWSLFHEFWPDVRQKLHLGTVLRDLN